MQPEPLVVLVSRGGGEEGILKEVELQPHLEGLAKLSSDVVLFLQGLKFLQFPLAVQRHADNLQEVGAGGGLLPSQVQVAEPFFLVDVEETLFVPLGNDVTHAVLQGCYSRQELQDVLPVPQIRQVQCYCQE